MKGHHYFYSVKETLDRRAAHESDLSRWLLGPKINDNTKRRKAKKRKLKNLKKRGH